MTILTAGACKFIITSSGHVIPAAVGSVAGIVMTGVKLWIKSEPVSVALATAVGTAASSGAIAGAAVGKTIASAATGALVGSLSAAGLGSVMAGSIAAASNDLTSGHIGLLMVGTSTDGNQIKHDCWKPVVRDTSLDPSDGMMLKDLIGHPHVANVTVTPSVCLPQILLENIWSEKFEIEYVVLHDSNKLFCHVNPLSK